MPPDPDAGGPDAQRRAVPPGGARRSGWAPRPSPRRSGCRWRWAPSWPGCIISESDYAHETLARLLPLRDTFVALFFVTIGALIDPRDGARQPARLLVTWSRSSWSGKLGDPDRRRLAVRRAVRRRRCSWAWAWPRSASSRSSSCRSRADAGHVGARHLQRHARRLAAHDPDQRGARCACVPRLDRLAPSPAGGPRPTATRRRARPPAGHVVLCGFGRVGSAIGEALETFGSPLRRHRARPGHRAGPAGARRARACSATPASARLLEQAGREHGPRSWWWRCPRSIGRVWPCGTSGALSPRRARSSRARTTPPRSTTRLREAGATEVIQPEVEAAATLIRHALRRLALPQERVLAYLDAVPPRHGPGRGRRERDHPRTACPQVREVALGAGALADRSLREARIRERLRRHRGGDHARGRRRPW